jgi:hypothetical protein
MEVATTAVFGVEQEFDVAGHFLTAVAKGGYATHCDAPVRLGIAADLDISRFLVTGPAASGNGRAAIDRVVDFDAAPTAYLAAWTAATVDLRCIDDEGAPDQDQEESCPEQPDGAAYTH